LDKTRYLEIEEKAKKTQKMIDKILPLTKIKIDILSELYQKKYNLTNLSQKINSKKQIVIRVLKQLLQEQIIKRDENVYMIKKEYEKLLEKILIQRLLEKRLKKYKIILSLIKKYYSPNEFYLFGSYVLGLNNKNSDLDFYVVSKLTEKENNKLALRFSKSLNKTVQIINVFPNINNTVKNKYSDIYNSISKDNKKGLKVDIESIEI
jgi:predicted nucleotidyltransferase